MNTSINDQNNNNNDDSLYAAHQKIYPREVQGRYRHLRTIATIVLLGLFYSTAWLKWNGHQAILFDLPARKFYVFGMTFLPQDFFFLTWLLVIAALTLFFVTAVAGRLWCGYACPQTVWTDVFVWMERLAEGKRQQRIKLDHAPWSFNKLWRKTFKQAMWISFSLYTGFTFVGYFTPIRQLFNELMSFSTGPWETFWVFFYGFATYGNAGFLREQVCKYMCPYARFQSAMFDRHTLIIAYDNARGEPRGSRGRGLDYKAEGLGDCIDCTLCVQACPTGIDIRKGLQYECIACAACIDACDAVMDKMNYPRGLVRYSTQAAIEGNAPHVLRPRTLIYASLLLLLIGGFAYAITHRDLVQLDVLRDRKSLYRELSNGHVENVYTVHIINKDTRPHDFRLSVEQLPDAVVDSERAVIHAEAGDVASVAVRINSLPLEQGGGHDIRIVVTAIDTPQLQTDSKTRFFSPD
ncbi:MAG TPA: cytochrome c oxidase accessory protein CcoG [Steroidobacteraceae bacterium]|nr:cytochrome c oxidase accessory protein CcoG [Steroidobacteraceae bacterium]